MSVSRTIERRLVADVKRRTPRLDKLGYIRDLSKIFIREVMVGNAKEICVDR